MEDMMKDVDAAIEWVFRNIERYGGDVSQIFLMGQSAGAHMVTHWLGNNIFHFPF